MERKLEFSSQAVGKILLHTIRYPHAICSGYLLSPADQEESEEIRVTETIPVSHASHGLAPGFEIALNSIELYAKDRNLVISGYYQSDPLNDANATDIFEQRILEKLGESYPNAILCVPHFDLKEAKPQLIVHHLIDGKLRRKSSQCISTEEDMDSFCKVLYSRDKLHKQIVDFDDHFNDISNDWTNAKVGQKLDELLVNL